MLANFNRALRLPFTNASILPYIFGSLIVKERFNFLTFCLGLAAAVGMHLSSNLMNDYADSKSSADWQDKKFYGFFEGVKNPETPCKAGYSEHLVDILFYPD